MNRKADVPDGGKNSTESRRAEAAERGKLRKRILAACILAAAVFAGVSLFWYGFRYLPYRKLAERMTPDSSPEMPRYTAVNGEYLFRIKMPVFLSFESGFLYVGPAEELASFVVDGDGTLKEKNVPHVDMFIWPKIFSGAAYGVTLYEESFSRQILVDREGEFIAGIDGLSGSEETVLRELYEKHREEIRDVISAAEDFWGSDLP